MADMRQDKIPVAEQEPLVRAKNFDEVTLGYSIEKAVRESRPLIRFPLSAAESVLRRTSVRASVFAAKRVSLLR